MSALEFAVRLREVSGLEIVRLERVDCKLLEKRAQWSLSFRKKNISAVVEGFQVFVCESFKDVN